MLPILPVSPYLTTLTVYTLDKHDDLLPTYHTPNWVLEKLFSSLLLLTCSTLFLNFSVCLITCVLKLFTYNISQMFFTHSVVSLFLLDNVKCSPYLCQNFFPISSVNIFILIQFHPWILWFSLSLPLMIIILSLLCSKPNQLLSSGLYLCSFFFFFLPACPSCLPYRGGIRKMTDPLRKTPWLAFSLYLLLERDNADWEAFQPPAPFCWSHL